MPLVELNLLPLVTFRFRMHTRYRVLDHLSPQRCGCWRQGSVRAASAKCIPGNGGLVSSHSSDTTQRTRLCLLATSEEWLPALLCYWHLRPVDGKKAKLPSATDSLIKPTVQALERDLVLSLSTGSTRIIGLASSIIRTSCMSTNCISMELPIRARLPGGSGGIGVTTPCPRLCRYPAWCHRTTIHGNMPSPFFYV